MTKLPDFKGGAFVPAASRNGPNAVFDGSFSPNVAPFTKDAPWDGINKRTGRPIEDHCVDPAFEIAASRYPEPRDAKGWPSAHPPRLGTAPGTLHRRPLEVEPGFLVSEIGTLAECDTARSILVDAILSIEGQIDGAVTRDRAGGPKLDLEWQRKARGALRAKKVALDEVEAIRARLKHDSRTDAGKSADRALLDVVKELDPILFAEAETAARARGLI